VRGFVSNFTNKLDAKGRVSIPAPFRAVLAADGFDGLYCFPSPHAPAIDAGGNRLLERIESLLDGLQPLSADYDRMSAALYGASEIVKIDGEGRIMLSDKIRAYTGITTQAAFVGLGFKFQIMAPERLSGQIEDGKSRAFGMLGGATAATSAGAAAAREGDAR
jgi:MraZ protein